MSGEREIFDRARNFVRSPNTPFGMRIPEVALRQLIAFSLQQIRLQLDTVGSPNIIDELFAMLDDEVRASIKTWLRDHPNIPVVINYPREDAGLPIIAVVSQGEQSTPDQTYLSDYAGTTRVRAANGVDAELEHSAIGEAHTRQIFILSADPNLTMYLYYLIKFILMSNMDQLALYYDLQNMQISGQDLRHEQGFFPAFAYGKVVQVTYTTHFDFSVSVPAANIVSVGVMVARGVAGVDLDVLVDAVRDGVTPPVSVPSEDS